MPGLGLCAPLAEGFKPARGTPALTLLCCSCRRDFGDTQGLALPFPSRERTLQSPPPGTKPIQPCPPPSALPSPHTTAPAEGTEVLSQRGQKCHPSRDRSLTPEGAEVSSQRGQKCCPSGSWPSSAPGGGCCAQDPQPTPSEAPAAQRCRDECSSLSSLQLLSEYGASILGQEQ